MSALIRALILAVQTRRAIRRYWRAPLARLSVSAAVVAELLDRRCDLANRSQCARLVGREPLALLSDAAMWWRRSDHHRRIHARLGGDR